MVILKPLGSQIPRIPYDSMKRYGCRESPWFGKIQWSCNFALPDRTKMLLILPLWSLLIPLGSCSSKSSLPEHDQAQIRNKNNPNLLQPKTRQT